MADLIGFVISAIISLLLGLAMLVQGGLVGIIFVVPLIASLIGIIRVFMDMKEERIP